MKIVHLLFQSIPNENIGFRKNRGKYTALPEAGTTTAIGYTRSFHWLTGPGSGVAFPCSGGIGRGNKQVCRRALPPVSPAVGPVILTARYGGFVERRDEADAVFSGEPDSPHGVVDYDTFLPEPLV
jgi:hypothetical protein